VSTTQNWFYYLSSIACITASDFSVDLKMATAKFAETSTRITQALWLSLKTSTIQMMMMMMMMMTTMIKQLY